MSNLKVLIVGASIAGPATAYWLAKAGAKVTVIERFSKLRTAGQAIDIRTAGVSVMREMKGMEAAIRAKRAREEGISLVREDGKVLGTITATGDPDQQALLSEYEILRGDLSRVLFDLTEGNENVEYVFDEQIASMTRSAEKDGPVKVEFANGTQAGEFDLVVGCDGVSSRTRAMGFDCNVREHILPTGSWIAHCTIGQDLLQGSKIGHGFSAVGGRSMSMGSDPPDRSRVMFMRVAPSNQGDPALPFREALSEGEDAVKQYISEQYKGAGWKTDVVLKEMTTSAEDFYASEFAQVKIPTLYSGRCVLVGDAGYAAGPTGGGTSLALAGAYMLAGEITKHPNDLEAALQGYEQQMRPLITEMQKIPPFFTSFLAPQTRWGIWLRNNVFAFLAWSNLVAYAQRYLGAAFASTESYPLPKYEWVA